MSLLRLCLVLVPLLFAVECIAQRPDLITVSNFLPRPSASPATTTPSPARPIPVPPLIVFTVPSTTPVVSTTSQNNDPPLNPLRLLPVPESPTVFRCNPKNTHYHPKTHKLLSQCRENTFCSASGPTNGTCVPILCRRDEFPFGFGFGGGGNTGIIDVELNELNLPIPTPTSTIRKSKKDRPKDLTTTMVLPDLCSPGSFCPDDGSGCKPQNGVGGPCELGRDEQCSSSQPSLGLTTDSAICLHLTCM